MKSAAKSQRKNPRYNHLLLASTSPQRQKILQDMGIRFVVVPNDFQETLFSRDLPVHQALRLSREKMNYYLAQTPQCALPILTADTVIGLKRQTLGKPQTEEEAWIFYQKLADKTHVVITAFSLFVPHQNAVFSGLEKTRVKFIAWNQHIYRQYLETQEWKGCAAGYQVQGKGAILISSINGSWTNVVGLPSHRIYFMLRKHSCFF